MCGRYLTPDQAAFERYWGITVPPDFEQSYNVAPSQLARSFAATPRARTWPHDRMLVALGPEAARIWLRADAEIAALRGPLERPGRAIVSHAVSTRVNKPENDDARLISPVS